MAAVGGERDKLVHTERGTVSEWTGEVYVGKCTKGNVQVKKGHVEYQRDM